MDSGMTDHIADLIQQYHNEVSTSTYADRPYIIDGLKKELYNKGVDYINNEVNENISRESLLDNPIYKRLFKIYLKNNLGITKGIDTAIVEILIELP